MTQSEFTPEQTRRSRLKAAALFAIAITPLIAATVMYYTGWGLPSTTTNNGEFVDGDARVLNQGLQDADGKIFDRLFLPENDDAKWWIIIAADECGEACGDWLEVTRNVHKRLHRDADRVRRGFVTGDDTVPDPAEHPRLLLLKGENGANPLSGNARESDTNATVFVADPMGNLVLRYDSRHNGTDLLDDVEHLLDSSPLG